MSMIPDFQLPGSDGALHSRKDLRGAITVLYWYPKDDTTGCTAEACSFRDLCPGLSAAGAQVIGISPDGRSRHERFIAKYDLPFLLLSDEDHAFAERCGVWVAKSMYGRSYFGIERSTFLIGPDLAIVQEWRKVKVAGHGTDVLEAVKALAAGGAAPAPGAKSSSAARARRRAT